MRSIVVGAGIAGTAAAIALRKAGMEATVYEAGEPGGEGVGAYLTLAVNGLRTLRAIDVEGAALGGFETPRVALHLGSGRQLVEFDYGPQQPAAMRSRTIKRAELYAALLLIGAEGLGS